MRKIAWLLGVALLAASASVVSAKPPAPVTCPPDVGAALAAACPCDASSGGQAWKNHGGYVSCVVHFRNDLRKAGCLDDTAKRTIARCAARSTCGKPNAVLCCFYDTSGTCSDPTPGDLIAAGFCSNDATKACDTNADCITATGPKLKPSADACIAKGGTPVGGGSVCSTCPSPSPVASPVPSPGPTP